MIEEEDNNGNVIVVVPALTGRHSQDLRVRHLRLLRSAVQGKADELAGNVLRGGEEGGRRRVIGDNLNQTNKMF